MYYIKAPTTRYIFIDNGIDLPEENKLVLMFKAENKSTTIDTIKTDFSNVDSITIYGCIIQDDGRETDEFTSSYYDKYTYLKSIEYDFENDTYKVTLIIPDKLEQRIETLEKAKPLLTSPFTDNAEPTGIASQFYDTDELIAIYEDGIPVTVKVTMPISYDSEIIVGLNAEKYYGG